MELQSPLAPEADPDTKGIGHDQHGNDIERSRAANRDQHDYNCTDQHPRTNGDQHRGDDDLKHHRGNGMDNHPRGSDDGSDDLSAHTRTDNGHYGDDSGPDCNVNIEHGCNIGARDTRTNNDHYDSNGEHDARTDHDERGHDDHRDHNSGAHDHGSGVYCDRHHHDRR